jgi:hypothetical protein
VSPCGWLPDATLRVPCRAHLRITGVVQIHVSGHARYLHTARAFMFFVDDWSTRYRSMERCCSSPCHCLDLPCLLPLPLHLRLLCCGCPTVVLVVFITCCCPAFRVDLMHPFVDVSRYSGCLLRLYCCRCVVLAVRATSPHLVACCTFTCWCCPATSCDCLIAACRWEPDCGSRMQMLPWSLHTHATTPPCRYDDLDCWLPLLT